MTTSTRYQSLADELAGCIRAGVLKTGDRLPSVRRLCALHRVSPATVTHALHRLEDGGLIEARPRQGFFVRAQRFAPPTQCAAPGLPQAVALEGHRKLVIEFAQDSDRHWLGMSALDDGFYPTKTLKKLLQQQLQRDEAILYRSSYGGDLALREQIARRSLLLGCDFRPDQIIVTNGDTEATDLCLRLLTKPGDLVAIQTPGPLRLLEMLEGHNLRVLEIPAHPCDGLSVAALDFALRHNRVAACVVNANFPSPTGSLMPDEEKARLADLAQRQGVPLIEVDTFGDLHYGEQRPKPVKAYDRHDNVLYCADLQPQIGLGGVGYIAAGRHRLTLEAARVVHGEPVAALLQATVAAFMASGQFDAHLRRLRYRLASQIGDYRRAVGNHFPPGIRVACGGGGFLLWLELPAPLDAIELQRRAQRAGYTFAPGVLFCLNQSFTNCLRFNAGFPLTQAVEEGIRVIGRLAWAMLDEAGETEGGIKAQ